MIYSNVALKAEETKWGHGFVIARKQNSKKERLLFIHAPEELMEIEAYRSLKGYKIDNKDGIKSIIPTDDDSRIFIILSSEGEHNQSGSGHVMVPKNSKAWVMSSLMEATAEYANECWDVYVVDTHYEDAIFRVIPSGFRAGNLSATFLIVMSGKVYPVDQPDIENFYAERGIPPPEGCFRRGGEGKPKGKHRGKGTGNRIMITSDGWRRL